MSREKPLTDLADPVWEIQEGETIREHRYFQIFRDLGEVRSIRMVGVSVGKDTQSMQCYLYRLARANMWNDRIAAWERHLSRQAAEQSAQDELNRRRRRSEERANFAQHMQGAGMAILMSAKLLPTKGPDGKPVPIPQDEQLTVAEARKLLRPAVELAQVGMVSERLEEGLATQIHSLVTQELEEVLEHLRNTLTTEEYEHVYRALAVRYGLAEGEAG